MAMRCPRCGREFDVTLFEFERTVSCPCGETLSLRDGHTAGGEKAGIDWDALEEEIFGAARLREEDRALGERIRVEADRIAHAIESTDIPRVDIEMEIRNFRRRVLAEFPDKAELLEGLYVSRFRRLWDLFRAEEGPLRD